MRPPVGLRPTDSEETTQLECTEMELLTSIGLTIAVMAAYWLLCLACDRVDRWYSLRRMNRQSPGH